MTGPRHFLPDQLLAEASAATGGLQDFGDADFRPALQVLCESLDGEAKVSELGRLLLKQKILSLLMNQLRIEDYFRRYPGIAAEIVAPPLVIVGLPRTGTTKLHRLLSCDPRLYWMAWWESYYPVPFPGETLEAPAARIAQARSDVAAMTAAMPQLMAIHPMDAEQADEEVMLMEHSFLSAFNAYADIPSYMHWLDRQDQAPAYRYLRRILQFLQWQKRRRGVEATRWVLKAPHHLLRMHVLMEVFPGAQVIQTHRDPLESIPSIASFIHTLWCIYRPDADAVSAGRSWSDIMRRALGHTMEFRQGQPAGRFLDVQFRDTVQRPLDVVRQVYAFAGLACSAQIESGMQRWLDQDRQQHPEGAHRYSAEAFGLSRGQIEQDFAAYRERYVIG